MPMSVRSFAGLRLLVAGLLLGASFAPASQARVEVTLDAATLNEFLDSVTPPVIDVPLPSGGSIALELHDLRVKGFDPSSGAGGRGHVLTTLRVAIPALGLEFPLTPHLSIGVEDQHGEKVCMLRFEKVEIPLPVTGALDLSSLLPSYRVPAEAAWTLSLRQGDVRVKSRLVDTRVGVESIRLGFDIDLAPQKPVRPQRS
jgi:hypothetical protein